jgi:hypothetical protein
MNDLLLIETFCPLGGACAGPVKARRDPENDCCRDIEVLHPQATGMDRETASGFIIPAGPRSIDHPQFIP